MGCVSSPSRNGVGLRSRNARRSSPSASAPSVSGGLCPAMICSAPASGASKAALELPVAGSSARRKPLTKSAATTGSPFDQRPSGRSVKVQVSPSPEISQDSAAPGTSSPPGASPTRPSNRSRMISRLDSSSARCGSRVSGSGPLPRLNTTSGAASRASGSGAGPQPGVMAAMHSVNSTGASRRKFLTRHLRVRRSPGRNAGWGGDPSDSAPSPAPAAAPAVAAHRNTTG